MAAIGRNTAGRGSVPAPNRHASACGQALRVSLLFTLLLGCALTAAEPPQDVIKVFRTAAESLAEQDAGLFLEQFDTAMPGYSRLKNDLEGLLARGYVISTLEFASDEGDEKSRSVSVDWVWRQSGGPQHRVLLKCRLERRGKVWKITALDPIGFLGETAP